MKFPEMLEIRPIVVDENNLVLGGNMRLKACIDAGLTEVPTIKADELTEAQKKEFILKDNRSYGQWDNELLLDFNKIELTDSGFEDWELIGIFGDNELESGYKQSIEGSNFNPEKVDVNTFITTNILFFNEQMIEFIDDKVKEAIRYIDPKDINFISDLKKLLIKHGKNTI